MSTTVDWKPWSDDPVARATGVSFNRTPAGKIAAPPAQFRVCAWHIDFDERPVCYVDVDSSSIAEAIAEALQANCRFNVDYACVYDERGVQIHSGRPW